MYSFHPETQIEIYKIEKLNSFIPPTNAWSYEESPKI